MSSIFVGAVVLFVFGALWYTVVFGRLWATLMGFQAQDKMTPEQKKGMVRPMIINFILQLITASVVYYLFPALLAFSFHEFLKTVLIIWIGFAFPIYANQALWEKKSWKLVALNSASGILSFTLVSAIIFYMQ